MYSAWSGRNYVGLNPRPLPDLNGSSRSFGNYLEQAYVSGIGGRGGSGASTGTNLNSRVNALGDTIPILMSCGRPPGRIIAGRVTGDAEHGFFFTGAVSFGYNGNEGSSTTAVLKLIACHSCRLSTEEMEGEVIG
jgi:hypothetical protein